MAATARKGIGIWVLVAAVIAAMFATAVPPTAAAAEDDTVVLQSDTFSRTSAAGWGDAETGGTWQLAGSGEASVDGSQGLLGVPQGGTRTASLGGTITGPAGVTATLSFPELPSTGDASAGVTLRQDGERLYYARVRVMPTGDAFLAVRGQMEGGVAWLLTPEVRLGRTVAGGTVSLVVGSEVDDTLVTAKAWLDGEEPPVDWQVRALEADLPDSGSIGLMAEAASDTPYLQVAFDDFQLLQQGENLPPEAGFTVAADGLTITVDGSASTDPDGTITTYEWDFGDGSSATGATPAPKTYAAEGTYTVALTVTDDGGTTGTTTQDVVVSAKNALPVASFTTAIDDLTVTVDASQSTDTDGEVVGWLWEYGDGATSQLQQPEPHTYAAAGEYTIALTVTDDRGGQGSAEQQVVATQNEAPVAGFLFTSRDRSLYVDGRFSTDSDGEIVSYAWDYGDGATATGAVPPIHTYAAGGEYSVALTVTDDNGAQNTSTKSVTIAGASGPVADRGAQLPIIYNLSDLPGTKRFVAPNGSNETGDGSEAKPYRTLQRALDVSRAGDSVVVRGGTYEIAKTAITKANITLTAYPGETPVFDGSMPAPTEVASEGSLKWVDYLPMPARSGEGLNISQLPQASFDPAGAPTGLAKERGWQCVASSGTYSRTAVDAEIEIPYDAPRTRAAGSGCAAGTTPRVITGLYPDQVWVDGKPLVQVLDKSRVKQGTFYVPRTSATDATPGPARLYLSAADAADMSKVRVSKSNDNFLIVQGEGVTVRGLQVRRHSPAWPFFAMTVTANTDDFTAEDMEFSYVASVATKVAGGDSAGGGAINDNPTMNRVTIDHSSWIGTSQLYTDDATISNSVITHSNYHREFTTAPKSGGIKATKTHRMAVVNSEISMNNGHGIWWDQSNYDATLANSDLRDNSDSALFYEISHGLAMVNNIVTRNGSPSSSPTVRLAGASGVIVVNNTIVGGQVPFALAGDPRSKSYGASKRPCAEHTERYRQGGSIASDCPPALSSDLDKARPGAFGSPNLTPELDWVPSASVIQNNIFANPVPGSGGICPGGYPLCVKAYSGPSSNPELKIPANEILPKGLIMNGNIYQSDGEVAEVLTSAGQQGGFTAQSVAELRGSTGLGSAFYGLNVEGKGLAGLGFVTPDGQETAKLVGLHGNAAPVPNKPSITPYLSAGTVHYGALRQGNEGEIPANLPTASFVATVTGDTVSVDASGSTYDQGTIAGYLWDFGDDTGIAVGRQVEHVYAAPGTYTVALGVVGTNGAFDIATKTVVILDPNVDLIADDTFTRAQLDGWGDADVGGPWTLSGKAANYSVDGERGAFELNPGQALRAVLNDATTTQADLSVVTGTGQSLTGSGIRVSAMPRTLPDGAAYRAKVVVKADGSTTLALTRINASGQETTIATAPTADLPTDITTATPLAIRVQALGTAPTTLRAKIWNGTAG